jgi:hypothetical protein
MTTDDDDLLFKLSVTSLNKTEDILGIQSLKRFFGNPRMKLKVLKISFSAVTFVTDRFQPVFIKLSGNIFGRFSLTGITRPATFKFISGNLKKMFF